MMGAAWDALPAPGTRLLVAASGGRDSQTLLDALLRLGRWPLHVAHVQHGLRAEDHLDQRAILRLLARWRQRDVQLTCERVSVHGALDASGIEATARRLRYAALNRIATAHRCAAIITAHHRDDQVETVLMQCLRGLRAPVGMALRETRLGRVPLVRPLLCVPRGVIAAEARRYQVPWCDDRTNQQRTARRNALRSDVLPLWMQALPALPSVLAESVAAGTAHA